MQNERNHNLLNFFISFQGLTYLFLIFYTTDQKFGTTYKIYYFYKQMRVFRYEMNKFWFQYINHMKTNHFGLIIIIIDRIGKFGQRTVKFE